MNSDDQSGHDLPDDLLRQFRAIDPEAGRPNRSVEHSEAKSALFEEITLTTAPAPTRFGSRRSFPRPSSLYDRPALAIPALVAVIALIGGGLFAIASAGAPSAAAAAIAAAEESGRRQSGHALTVIAIDVLGESPEDAGSRTTIEYRFEGDDYLVGFTSTFPAADEELSSYELSVDGTNYFSQTPGEWVATTGDVGFTGPDMWGFSPGTAAPDAMVDVIKLAPDITESDGSGPDGDPVTVYSGTILATDLVALGDELPVGLKLLASGDDPTADLPEQLDLRVTVADELLTEVAVDMNGETPTGEFIDASFTTTYSGFGEPQEIEAPTADQLVESLDFDFPEESAEVQAAVEALIDLEERRPDLCGEAIGAAAFPDPATPPEEMAAHLAETAAAIDACLREAGEAEVADLVAESGMFNPGAGG